MLQALPGLMFSLLVFDFIQIVVVFFLLFSECFATHRKRCFINGVDIIITIALINIHYVYNIVDHDACNNCICSLHNFQHVCWRKEKTSYPI